MQVRICYECDSPINGFVSSMHTTSRCIVIRLHIETIKSVVNRTRSLFIKIHTHKFTIRIATTSIECVNIFSFDCLCLALFWLYAFHSLSICLSHSVYLPLFLYYLVFSCALSHILFSSFYGCIPFYLAAIVEIEGWRSA